MKSASLNAILEGVSAPIIPLEKFERLGKHLECSIDSIPKRYVEFFLKELELVYVPDIPFEKYIEIMDGSTAKSLRDVLKDTQTKTVDKIPEYIASLKQDILDLEKRRTIRTKIFYSISDIVGTSARKISKVIPVGASPQTLSGISEFFFQKGKPLLSKAIGKKSHVLQLHHTIKKLEKVKLDSF
jgi:hypothetical protein